jgi:hypothetical protein
VSAWLRCEKHNRPLSSRGRCLDCAGIKYEMPGPRPSDAGFYPVAVAMNIDLKGRDPVENEWLIQFFEYKHLPPHLQAVSQPFGELASKLMDLPRNPERTVALRKLLEAKDAAVRARLAGDPSVAAKVGG